MRRGDARQEPERRARGGAGPCGAPERAQVGARRAEDVAAGARARAERQDERGEREEPREKREEGARGPAEGGARAEAERGEPKRAREEEHAERREPSEPARALALVELRPVPRARPAQARRLAPDEERHDGDQEPRRPRGERDAREREAYEERERERGEDAQQRAPGLQRDGLPRAPLARELVRGKRRQCGVVGGAAEERGAQGEAEGARGERGDQKERARAPGVGSEGEERDGEEVHVHAGQRGGDDTGEGARERHRQERQVHDSTHTT